jgi:hypothetical protein
MYFAHWQYCGRRLRYCCSRKTEPSNHGLFVERLARDLPELLDVPLASAPIGASHRYNMRPPSMWIAWPVM